MAIRRDMLIWILLWLLPASVCCQSTGKLKFRLISSA